MDINKKRSIDELASVLAGENLDIIHADVKKGRFDFDNRTLVLPAYEDEMDEDIMKMIVSDQVANALNTNMEDVSKPLRENKDLDSVFNITNLVRTQRLIKAKYPGIKRTFNRGYINALKQDYFGMQETGKQDPSEYNFLDRMFMHFTMGGVIDNIPFSEDEKKLLTEASRAYTTKDALDVARKIYKKIEEEEEEKQDGAGDGEGDGDQEGLAGSQSGDSGSGNGGSAQRGNKPKAENNPFQSQLANNFDERVEEQRDEDPPVSMTLPPKIAFSEKKVIDHKEVLREQVNISKLQRFRKEYMQRYRKYISFLAQQFDIKKRGNEFSKTREEQRGEINENKLFSYKYDENIFLTDTITPTGKNHGVFMVIDSSGSMGGDSFKGSLDQAVMLSHFCRRVNIPFAVNLFTDHTYNETNCGYSGNYYNTLSEAQLPTGFAHVEIFNNTMNQREMDDMTSLVLSYAESNHTGNPYVHTNSGTPLDASIMQTMDQAKEFKQANGIDLLTVVYLTDGGNNAQVGYNNNTTFVDTVTKKAYHHDDNTTASLFNAMKDRLNCRVMGIRIGGLWGIKTNVTTEQFEKMKWLQVNEPGYDSMFIWNIRKVDEPLIGTDSAILNKYMDIIA